MADKSLAAIRYGKAMFYRQRQIRLADACARAGDVMAHLEQDADEGIAAFVGKRQATWTSCACPRSIDLLQQEQLKRCTRTMATVRDGAAALAACNLGAEDIGLGAGSVDHRHR